MSEILVPSAYSLFLDELTLTSPSQLNRSGWTGKRKVVGLPGIELWRGKATIDLLTTEEEERPWRAFLFALRGSANWFKHVLPCNTHAGSRPVVASGATNGYTIPLSGMAAGTILKAGQFMTVPLPSGYNRAVCLTTNLVSSGGTGTATFEPALGEVPTGGATVETIDPYIRMAPSSSTQGFSISDSVSSTSFDVEEAR
jgi:hypothetical protein